MNTVCVSWIQSCPIVGGNVRQESLSSLSLLHVKSFPIMFPFSFIRGRHCFGTAPADRVQFTGGVRLPAIHNKLVSIFWHCGFFGSVISLICSALPDIFCYAIFPSLSFFLSCLSLFLSHQTAPPTTLLFFFNPVTHLFFFFFFYHSPYLSPTLFSFTFFSLLAVPLSFTVTYHVLPLVASVATTSFEYFCTQCVCVLVFLHISIYARDLTDPLCASVWAVKGYLNL